MKRWRVLLFIWVVALLFRGAYLGQIADAPFFDLRIGDAASYHEWARRIADGDWLGRDVFYQAPLYPYLLALIYRLLGDSVIVVRLVQACLGAASCVCLAAAGMSLLGPRGAIAGLAFAVYPSAIFFDGLLEKSALVTFLTTALLALLASSQSPSASSFSSSSAVKAPLAAARTTTPLRWMAAGVVLGLLALTRENALLLAIPILLWILLDTAVRGRSRAIAALAFVAGCALILSPVSLRNVAVSGELHLTTSQLGPNFYIGNHPGATGTYEPLVVGHGSYTDEREDATRLAEQGSGRRLAPGEVSRFWTTRAVAYIRAQPLDWLGLMARKLALTFNASEVADTESQDVYAEWSWLLRVLRPFDFGLVLAAAAFGAALTAGEWRRLWFLYAIAATYAGSVILFYVFARYRFPIVPVLLLLAAGGVVQTFAAFKRHEPERRARKRRERGSSGPRRRLAVAGAVAAAALACAHLPLADERGARATHLLGIAGTLAKDPARTSDAMTFYARALQETPQFPAAQFGLATMMTRMGRSAEALPYFREAVRAWPDHAEARYNFGLALAATGDAQEASRQYTEALRINPDDPDTHLALAKALITLEQPDRAVPHYERSLALRPQDTTALVGLGVALTQLGRSDQAIQHYRTALLHNPRDASAENSFGWTLATEGRLDEAVPHFERALALNPADENARRNLEQARQLQQSRGKGK